MLTMRRTTMNILPMTSSSTSEACFLNRVQMSIVKIVEAELNTDVREDIKAAIITASIRPRSPDTEKEE